jgi:hypothetical membrane protein
MDTPERLRAAAGVLLAVAGSAILLGIITAEALYPARYTTFDNEISDLGATKPPDSVILQPSATIFDVTMVVTGLAIAVAAVLLLRTGVARRLAIPTLLAGVGVLGVGVFPGNVGSIHPWFALLAFVAGGVAALTTAFVTPAPLRWVAGTLGAVSLVTLIYTIVAGLDAPIVSDLGDGGTERWVAYPVVLWLVLLGGALMSGVRLRGRASEAVDASET